MQTNKILSAAVLGTTAMTLFSYLISDKKKKNFLEPDVLSQLINRIVPIDKDHAELAGWGSHYSTGVIFATAYAKLLEVTKMKPTLLSGLLFGTGSGLLGMLAWKLTFKGHPNPPIKDLKGYLGHLLLAHMVFGTFATAGYNIIGPVYTATNIEPHQLN